MWICRLLFRYDCLSVIGVFHTRRKKSRDFFVSSKVVASMSQIASSWFQFLDESEGFGKDEMGEVGLFDSQTV